MVKVVLDTSVFVAGLLTRQRETSSAAQVIHAWRTGKFSLVISPQILRELVAKLVQKNVSDDAIVDLVSAIGKIALQIPGAYESTRLDQIDPDDNKFLSAAYESRAHFLVSYDLDLLGIKHFHGTQILLPRLFIRQNFDATGSGEIREWTQSPKYEELLTKSRNR